MLSRFYMILFFLFIVRIIRNNIVNDIIRIFSGCKFIDKIRNHVKDLCHSILIFDIHKFCYSILDDKNRTRIDFSTHTSGTVIFLFL